MIKPDSAATKRLADATSSAANHGVASSDLSQSVIVIHGIFDPAGEELLELKPVRQYTYHSGPIPNQPAGRFVVKIIYVTGDKTTVPFDALVADDAGRTQHGFFEVVVPVIGEIETILVSDASGEKTFARIVGSEILR